MQQISTDDDFDKASVPDIAEASPGEKLDRLTSERDQLFRKAGEIAREILPQIIKVDEDDKADPIYLTALEGSKNGRSTDEESDIGKTCIAGIVELKSTISKALEIQDNIWDAAEEFRQYQEQLKGKPVSEHIEFHDDDPIMRKILVACSIYLGVNDVEKTFTTTDFNQAMITQSHEDPEIEDLYTEAACVSLKLLRKCLDSYDRSARKILETDPK